MKFILMFLLKVYKCIPVLLPYFKVFCKMDPKYFFTKKKKWTLKNNRDEAGN